MASITMGALTLEALAAKQLYCHNRSLTLKSLRVGGLTSNAAKSSVHSRKLSEVRACLPPSASGDTRADEGVAGAGAGHESVDTSESSEGKKKKLSSQSSWEATDVLGNDYLYRLGKEADNLNITVGAKTGMVDSLFTGNFLGQEGESCSSPCTSSPKGPPSQLVFIFSLSVTITSANSL